MAERSEIDGNELGRILDEARAALADLRPARPAVDDSAVRGEGTAVDGSVRVMVRADGYVESISLQPRVTRRGAEELASSVVTAVNAARDDLREQLQGRASATAVAWDPTKLLRMQHESALRLAAVVDGFAGVMSKSARAAGVDDTSSE